MTDSTTHDYRRVRVAVAGGESTVGLWEPVDRGPGPVPTVCVIHGITSNHLFLAGLVAALPGVRVIGPDLRGRGGSRDLGAPYGMRAQAESVLQAIVALAEPGEVTLVGHSLGGFIAITLAGLFEAQAAASGHRFGALILIDGGLPRPPRTPRPPEVESAYEAFGPAARLTRVFEGPDDHLDFFRAHPAFAGGVGPVAADSFAYDLVADGGGGFHASTLMAAMQADSDDVYGGPDFARALDRVMGESTRRSAVHLIVAESDLVAAVPGLYTPQILDDYRRRWPEVRVTKPAGTNHYDVVLSDAGVRSCAAAVLAALTSSDTS